jgi:hypothetical protein
MEIRVVRKRTALPGSSRSSWMINNISDGLRASAAEGSRVEQSFLLMTWTLEGETKWIFLGRCWWQYEALYWQLSLPTARKRRTMNHHFNWSCWNGCVRQGLNDDRAVDREILFKCSSQSGQYRPFTAIWLKSHPLFHVEGTINPFPWAPMQQSVIRTAFMSARDSFSDPQHTCESESDCAATQQLSLFHLGQKCFSHFRPFPMSQSVCPSVKETHASSCLDSRCNSRHSLVLKIWLFCQTVSHCGWSSILVPPDHCWSCGRSNAAYVLSTVTLNMWIDWVAVPFCIDASQRQSIHHVTRTFERRKTQCEVQSLHAASEWMFMKSFPICVVLFCVHHSFSISFINLISPAIGNHRIVQSDGVVMRNQIESSESRIPKGECSSWFTMNDMTDQAKRSVELNESRITSQLYTDQK